MYHGSAKRRSRCDEVERARASASLTGAVPGSAQNAARHKPARPGQRIIRKTQGSLVEAGGRSPPAISTTAAKEPSPPTSTQPLAFQSPPAPTRRWKPKKTVTKRSSRRYRGGRGEVQWQSGRRPRAQPAGNAGNSGRRSAEPRARRHVRHGRAADDGHRRHRHQPSCSMLPIERRGGARTDKGAEMGLSQVRCT